MNEYPNELEMEKSVLGAMMQYGDKAILPLEGVLTAEDFYRPSHQLIFAAVQAIYARNVKPDILLVEAELEHNGQLGLVEREYLWSLLEKSHSATRSVSYAGKIKDAAIRRDLIKQCQVIMSEAGDGLKSAAELVAYVDKMTTTLTSGAGEQPWASAKELTMKAYEELIERGKTQGLHGVRTGLRDLDYMTGGLKKSDLIILAARPAMGKTALAMNIALAASRDVPVLIFSLEMSKGQLTDRLISTVSGVSLARIIDGRLSKEEQSAICDTLQKMYERNWSIDDTGGLCIAELKMRARRFKHQRGLGLIVIDYLQLIRGSAEYRGNRVQEVSEISRELKSLAKALDVPILALSQLSRNVEMRAERKPQLSDLRESGSIEQDADIVMFLYRGEYYERAEENQNLAEIIMAKNRNGAVGSRCFRFDAENVCFHDLVRWER